MSVVAVKVYDDKIVIGADSQSTSYWHNKDSTNKIYKISNSFVIGGVGYTSHNQMMYLFCETNKPAGSRKRDILEFFVQFNDWMRKKTDDFRPYNSFLIVFGDKAFWVTNDLMIKEITDYCAIGSGMEYAKAGLYLGKTVQDSIRIACDLTIYCSGPIERYEVKKKGKK
jgi:20S proteasome alpha/beta subunit